MGIRYWLESDGEKQFIWRIFPNFCSSKCTWVTAYDDYPMTSISAKQAIFKQTFGANYWFYLTMIPDSEQFKLLKMEMLRLN